MEVSASMFVFVFSPIAALLAIIANSSLDDSSASAIEINVFN